MPGTLLETGVFVNVIGRRVPAASARLGSRAWAWRDWAAPVGEIPSCPSGETVSILTRPFERVLLEQYLPAYLAAALHGK